MGTIEYIPSNNSTFANYPVSGVFRTCEISGFLAVQLRRLLLCGVGWQQITNADRL